MNKRKKWTTDDVKFLIDNYKTMDNESLAKHFNVGRKAIEAKLHKLGLKRRKSGEEHKFEFRIPISKQRKEAIEILDKGIRLYYEGLKDEAIKEFNKIIKDFSEEVDIVRKAKEFLEE